MIYNEYLCLVNLNSLANGWCCKVTVTLDLAHTHLRVRKLSVNIPITYDCCLTPGLRERFT